MKSIFEFRFLNSDLRNSGGVGLSQQKLSQIRQLKIKNQKSKIVAGIALGATLAASASHFDGSRTLPVHRIPLSSEDGQKIISTVPGTMPFSAMMTCEACHD